MKAGSELKKSRKIRGVNQEMPQELADNQHLIVNNGNFTLLWIFNHR
jgi:hypothetical protein